MGRGVHGKKIEEAIINEKMPKNDIPRLKRALTYYDKWVKEMENVKCDDLRQTVHELIGLLNEYKYYIDYDLIFCSKDDFLYRQKGQTKLDNTVLEEFLPIFVRKCLATACEDKIADVKIDSQTQVFSAMSFAMGLGSANVGGGMTIKTKAQDFSMTRKLYIQSSFDPQFGNGKTKTIEANVGCVVSEIKTNLDKTMFQEASATAHDVKSAVSGGKYFLLCDFLDMTPISSSTTDIDEIMITRKAKRISSDVRKKFAEYKGRQQKMQWYSDFLKANPYSETIFLRYIEHILAILSDENLVEEDVLEAGFF